MLRSAHRDYVLGPYMMTSDTSAKHLPTTDLLLQQPSHSLVSPLVLYWQLLPTACMLSVVKHCIEAPLRFYDV
jgi:hypothetical protein